MKYYIIAGEASGDLHGGNLMRELYQQDPQSVFRFWGGDQMSAVADGLVTHYRDIAYMGFTQVILHLPEIMRGMSRCKADIKAFEPDAIVLIDYPGFNLRIAEWAHREGYNVQYYISPQVWAWKSRRAKKITDWSNDLYVILPFEKDFYRKRNLPVTYVGHPLLDAIDSYRESAEDTLSELELDDRPLVVLLPGSRRQEINSMLPIMLWATRELTDHQIVIGGISSASESIYTTHLQKHSHARLVFDKTYSLLARADFALVTSGTATLETALFNVPQVVCYKGGILNYFIARLIVDVPYISLVNLILDQPLVKELIQHDLTISSLRKEIAHLQSKAAKKEIKDGYALLREKLGNKGTSARVASQIISSCL